MQLCLHTCSCSRVSAAGWMSSGCIASFVQVLHVDSKLEDGVLGQHSTHELQTWCLTEYAASRNAC
jgi:hypothetical protein